MIVVLMSLKPSMLEMVGQVEVLGVPCVLVISPTQIVSFLCPIYSIIYLAFLLN